MNESNSKEPHGLSRGSIRRLLYSVMEELGRATVRIGLLENALREALSCRDAAETALRREG